MKQVYLLKQTQDDEGYSDKTIAVYENESDAQAECDFLNKKYKDDSDNHFYEVETMEVNYSFKGKELGMTLDSVNQLKAFEKK